MNDGLLLVNFAALQGASASINSAVAKLRNDLAELEGHGKDLAETWDGEAKAAYYARQTRWQNAAAELTETLRRIQRAVIDSADDYQQTERTATNRFQ